MADKDRRFVLVVSPAYVKPLRDGSKVAIIYPGASPQEVEKFNKAVEDLREAPNLTVTMIKPVSLEVTLIEVRKIEEVRGG